MEISTIADIVRVHGTEHAETTALVLGDRRQSWGELYDRAKRVAGALTAAGVGRDDRVAFLDKNGIEHFEIQFGAALLGAVSVDVNWRLAPPEIAYIVGDAEAKVFVVGAEFAGVLDTVVPALPPGATVVVIGGHPTYADYESWVASGEAIDPHVGTAPSDVAVQLYSSGTTGRPKGVMLSNDNFFSLAPAATAQWGLSPDSVSLVAMPLFHIGGSGWALAGMTQGCTSVIVRDFDPAGLVELIGKERITHGFVVPAVLQFTMMAPNIGEGDFSSLQTILYGASPISTDVLTKALSTFGCDFWQVYGLTETTGAITHLPPSDHDPQGPNAHRLRSCGLPGPDVEVRIVDTTSGQDVPVGDVGEIWVRSPQVMVGYWHQPEETAKAITDGGWFHTGDVGYLDADGYLYIHDRVKDMIVSGGENVYPAEVENVLMGHPAVADAAVIGVPDDRWGETPKALIVRVPGATISEEELIAYCREHLARFKCPTSVEWVTELPRNPSGKILKKDLRAPYWEGRERHVN